MTNVGFLIEILGGGLLVLYSYYWASLQPNAGHLWGGISHPLLRLFWGISGLTTAFGFLFLTFFLTRYEDLTWDYYVLFATILIPASLWARITFKAMETRRYWLLFLDLSVVSIASILIAWRMWTFQEKELFLFGSILVFHHLWLDNIIWFYYFIREHEQYD